MVAIVSVDLVNCSWWRQVQEQRTSEKNSTWHLTTISPGAAAAAAAVAITIQVTGQV
jgi:hypothetical protein